MLIHIGVVLKNLELVGFLVYQIINCIMHIALFTVIIDKCVTVHVHHEDWSGCKLILYIVGLLQEQIFDRVIVTVSTDCLMLTLLTHGRSPKTVVSSAITRFNIVNSPWCQTALNFVSYDLMRERRG